MKSRFRIQPIDAMVLLAIAGYCVFQGVNHPPRSVGEPSTFARQVRLDPLDKTAVQADGRLRSFESHAKTYMGYVSGPRSINDQSYGFTFLDLIFRPEQYHDRDIIYVKNKNVRAQILDALHGHPAVDETRRALILKSGLVSRTLLSQPAVIALLQRLGQDLIRTAKAVNALQSALTVSDGRFLLDSLRMVAPPGGEQDKPWLSPADLAANTDAPSDAVHAGIKASRPIPGLDPELQKEIADSWTALGAAWRAGEAANVNARIAELAAVVPTVSPELYPSGKRLAMESWYFRTNSMTWVWLIYLAAVIPLLMSVTYKWDGARKIGMALFVLAFLFHTASLGVRWYISGRWPNANMFEAVTTAAWFGGVGALILEKITWRTPLRNLFALGSAVMSMGALMAAYYLPAQLDSSIRNKMAALNDVWLYIHTNVIIWSYAVIGLACVPAMLQLRHRWCVLWESGAIPKLRLLILPIAIVILNYTGYRLLMHLLDDPARELVGRELFGVAGAFWGSLMIVLMEWNSARARRAAGVSVERSASGGAAFLILSGGRGEAAFRQPARVHDSASSFLKPQAPAATEVLDGATMVLVEVAFIMLWTGVVMGAVWADHSWGRPWGWDPKEVFALNTFIIFLVLIHVRLKVRDKAFWTAVLAIVGFEVMMFNWIVVNFIITGLHSYA